MLRNNNIIKYQKNDLKCIIMKNEPGNSKWMLFI